LNDQLLETINEDTYNLNYHYYFTDEKRKQFDKVIKVVETNNSYQIYLPLLFWFYNESSLSIFNGPA
jgi:hypothetical protein